MLNAQEDVITDVRMSIEIMTYVLQMSKLQSRAFSARTTYEVAFQALRAARLHLATLFHAFGAVWVRFP